MSERIYKCCIVDDCFIKIIPHDDAIKRDSNFCEYAINQFIMDDDWSEVYLKNLIDEITETKIFNLRAYGNPQFLIDSNDFQSDVLIFDWDYSGLSEPVEELLRKILKLSYSIIFIFSGADKELEIKNVIDGILSQYKNRLIYADKDATGVKDIVEKIKTFESTDISFQYGSELWKSSIRSVGTTLSTFGSFGIDVLIKQMVKHGDGINELIEFIGEKYKTYLNENLDMRALNLEEAVCPHTADNAEKSEVKDSIPDLSNLWAFRLYTENRNEEVHRGDILQIEEKYYLVITPACNLKRFWGKTFGILSVVRVYDIIADKSEISTILKRGYAISKSSTAFSSITNGITKDDSILALPFLDSKNFILFMNKIENFEIDIPKNLEKEDGIKKTPLKISYINNAKCIKRLNEPFLSGIIDTIVGEIRGLGTPDYDAKTLELIHTNIRDKMRTSK